MQPPRFSLTLPGLGGSRGRPTPRPTPPPLPTSKERFTELETERAQVQLEHQVVTGAQGNVDDSELMDARKLAGMSREIEQRAEVRHERATNRNAETRRINAILAVPRFFGGFGQ